MADEVRERDLVLDQRQFALVLDATKGNVVCYVGPHKTSLAGTDRPVKFDGVQFVRCSTEEAIQNWPVAKEGDYIVLENPAEDNSHPNPGSSAGSSKLSNGRKVNVPGPVSFSLWPGQKATVRPGHALRSNQFLVAVVYNDKEASRNWSDMVLKPQATSKPKDAEEKAEADEKQKEQATADVVKKQVGELTMGKRLIIKGTDVSFFIPPTGVEVMPDEDGKFVRDAVTLETLEYCILVDENGKKRYVRGPAVVFPEPTEDFVRHQSDDGKKTRKFKAIELNPQCGIYVKVIEPYQEGDKTFKEGDELFITGSVQKIYFPRAEHALVRYDGASDRIFAITIPTGEARYVLDKKAETIKLIKGPKIFLPDPRNEVIVRRVLTQREVEQWFPGNTQAKQVNQALAAVSQAEHTRGYVSENSLRAKATRSKGQEDSLVSASFLANSAQGSQYGSGGFAEEEAVEARAGDELSRHTRYTPPRELVIDSKYDGAILIDVWTGYAVQVRSKTGSCEVIVGPKPRLLDYDETLDRLDLSMGTPKSRKNGTLRTVYLRIRNNRVSDMIQAETADLVNVSLTVAYRVDFEGDSCKWFQVEDYVQLLSEHTRSVIRNHVKKLGVKDFVADSVALVRDMILGRPVEAGKRPFMRFEENGMVIRDVEVLDVKIGDNSIASMLISSQQSVVKQELELASNQRQLELAKELERTKRERDQAVHETKMTELERQKEFTEIQGEVSLKRLQYEQKTEESRKMVVTAAEEVEDEREARARARRKASQELEVIFRKALQEIDLETMEKGTEAVVAKFEAISPDLIAALQVHGDKVITAEAIKELGAMAAITGDSVHGVFKRLLHGSVLADVFTTEGNGKAGLAVKAVERAGLQKDQTE